MKATMTDVAARAGVSQATVSRVLSKHPSIREQTREGVLKAMRELGYKHFVEDGALRRAELCAGLLMCPRPEQSNPLGLHFFSEAVAGVQSQAAKLGIRIAISTLPANAPSFDESKQAMGKVDGTILMGYPSLELTASLRARGLAHVALSGDPIDMLSDGVTTNNFEAGVEACQRMLSWGCQRLGYIISANEATRADGFLHELRKHGLEVAKDHGFELGTTDTAAFIDAWKRLIRTPALPEAMLIASHDAARALMALHGILGIEKPMPKFICFYHSPCEGDAPSMQLHPKEMGVKAMRRLAFLLDNPGDSPESIVVPMSFKDASGKEA